MAYLHNDKEQLLEEKVSYDTVIAALKQIAESEEFKE